MTKRYQSSFETPLGVITVSCNDKSITELGWTITPVKKNDDHPLITKAMEQLTAYFENDLKIFDLPLAPEGTEFQQKVWKALLEIKHGATASYLDIARQLGDPKATRAVGAANGKNPIAVVIPCHRVVGSSGKLTGYAGGLQRKRYLLELEQAGPQMSLF